MFSSDVELLVEIGDAERSVRFFDSFDSIPYECGKFRPRSCGDEIFENGKPRTGRLRS